MKTKTPSLLECSLNRAILQVAIPAIATSLAMILFELVDIYWIGKIGKNAVAGAGMAGFVMWCLYAFVQLSSLPTNTFVAQNIGRGQTQQAIHCAWRGMELSLVIALLVWLGGQIYQTQLFGWLQVRGVVRQAAEDYFAWIVAGFPVIFLFQVSGRIFNAHGDSRTNMFVFWATLALNMLLDPLFIFHYRLGVSGAAMASIFSQLLGLTVRLVLLFQKGYLGFVPAYRPLSLAEYPAFIKIGAPMTLTNSIFSMVYPILASFLSTNAKAGLNIGHRIESLAFFTVVGFSIAAQTVTAQYIGAGRLRQARQAAFRAVQLASLAILLISAHFILIPEHLVSLLINDNDVVAQGASYLRIIGIFEVFLAFEIVMEGAFSGVGQTYPFMIISIPLTLMRIPAGYWMMHTGGLGACGVWLAIGLSTFAKGSLLVIWFGQGAWQKRFSSLETQAKLPVFLKNGNTPAAPEHQKQQ